MLCAWCLRPRTVSRPMRYEARCIETVFPQPSARTVPPPTFMKLTGWMQTEGWNVRTAAEDSSPTMSLRMVSRVRRLSLSAPSAMPLWIRGTSSAPEAYTGTRMCPPLPVFAAILRLERAWVLRPIGMSTSSGGPVRTCLHSNVVLVAE